ncbi:hypothetical protein EBBID32_39510 [Sphingobium indicum BiD32]|uniref:Uncharacterized protein n=1 Tax=Sphingobium indicum BiD32 TaxID=1301087 RepID=N1MWB7_9SPHN|nr:hypothetical protein [Sphingobium indicum]CCW19583.1 hypothetical protein EBBID32_39510 [Sphingobium indicum BiD32]
MTDTESASPIGRTQRRLLRRIYNGRTVPIIADGKGFLTYKDALKYLEVLEVDARDTVYEEMKASAKNGKAAPPQS